MLLEKLANRVKASPFAYNFYLLFRDFWSYLHYRRRGSFSQHGEDAFLNDFFKDKPAGFYVDIGCSHPFRISNSYALYRRGWNGIAVDAIPSFAWLYRLWRPRDLFLNLGVMTYFELTPSVLSSFDKAWVDGLLERGEASIFRSYNVDVLPLNTILDKHGGGRKIDFLSVDVEGLDLEILNSIDFDRYRPRVICVEFNDPATRDTLIALLSGNGYNCSREVGCNIMAVDSNNA
jgi:hypothetical protein